MPKRSGCGCGSVIAAGILIVIILWAWGSLAPERGPGPPPRRQRPPSRASRTSRAPQPEASRPSGVDFDTGMGSEAIEQILDAVLGRTNREAKRFQGARIEEWDPAPLVKVSVVFAADERLNDRFVAGRACMDLNELAEALQEEITNLGYLQVTVTFSMEDDYGEHTERDIVRVGFSRETLESVRWRDCYGESILDAADWSWVHPRFE